MRNPQIYVSGKRPVESGYGLMPDVTKALPDPVLTYRHWDLALGRDLSENLNQNANIIFKESV